MKKQPGSSIRVCQAVLLMQFLFLASAHEIVKRDIQRIGNAYKDFQLWLPPQRLIVLVCFFRYVSINGDLRLRKSGILPALAKAF